MVTTPPYLPHLFQDIVGRVSTAMEARASDPFKVFYHYGIYQDIAKVLNKKRMSDEEEIYPLVALIMPYELGMGKAGLVDASIDMLIIMPSETSYTMQQRETLVLFPRLMPIYDELIKQVYSSSKYFAMPSRDTIEHRMRYLPYWGGNEAGNADAKNLFDAFVDAIHIKGLSLKVKLKNIC